MNINAVSPQSTQSTQSTGTGETGHPEMEINEARIASALWNALSEQIPHLTYNDELQANCEAAARFIARAAEQELMLRELEQELA